MASYSHRYRTDVNETCRRLTCAFMGFQTACSGKSVPTFRDNLSVPSLTVARFKRDVRKYCKGVTRSWKMGPTDCPETSVRIYRCTLCKIPEEDRSYLYRGGSLKTRISAATSYFLISATHRPCCGSLRGFPHSLQANTEPLPQQPPCTSLPVHYSLYKTLWYSHSA